MTRIHLKGLALDGFPLAALAAYSLPRILGGRGITARIGFDDAAYRPKAFLETNLSKDELIDDHLLPFVLSYNRRQRGIVEAAKEGKKDKKTKGSKKKRKASGDKRVLELPELSQQGRLDQVGPEHLQAYLAQLPGPNKGVQTTPFDTSKGQQGFLKALNIVVGLLETDPGRTKEALRRTLFENVLLPPGDQLFKEKIPRLGWHSSQFRRTADQARISNQEENVETTRLNPAAILLAWEALPLFPFLPGQPLPVGFSKRGRRYRVYLPTPHLGVELPLLRNLIALAPVLNSRVPDLPVWVSDRIGSKAQTDDYPCFLNAVPAKLATE